MYDGSVHAALHHGPAADQGHGKGNDVAAEADVAAQLADVNAKLSSLTADHEVQIAGLQATCDTAKEQVKRLQAYLGRRDPSDEGLDQLKVRRVRTCACVCVQCRVSSSPV